MNATPTVGDMMVAYSQDAVDYCRAKFAIDLDYSEGSVERVEDMLGRLHEHMPGFLGRLFRRGPSAHDLDVLSKMMGGYIGEVMKRHWGDAGSWRARHFQVSQS